MAGVAIRAEGLSKKYRIGQMRRGYDTLRDQLGGLATRVRSRREPRPAREEFWALEDVSFTIGEGEIVGLIGRNGAGKTTLLRVLSRITEPTRGFADIYGRLGSLLEVGTGFHPELTGRENIFLNGAILGMKRAEVTRKFDEIVEFAGVERFLDTPVKRYSSGMYVRLAFSVAAHLDLEVLLVDEVLAVGDAEFQKRSLGKLDDVSQSGRTVIFVSHNMSTLTRLCDRGLLLDRGKLVDDGPVEDVVARYLAGAYGSSADRVWAPDEAPGSENVKLRSVRVVDSSGTTAAVVDVREPVGLELVFDILRVDAPPFVPWLAFFNEQEVHMFSAIDTAREWRESRPPGRYTSTAWIPANLLNEGTVKVSVSLNTFVPGRSVRQAHADSAVSVQIVDAGEGDTARGHYGGAWSGPVRPLLPWVTEFDGALTGVVSRDAPATG